MLSNRRHRWSALLLAVFAFLAPCHADAQPANEPFLKLLQILRDRGAITAVEYEELRLAAGVPAGAPAAPPPAPAPAPATVESRVAALEAKAAPSADDAVRKALAGKWYERIGLRGYTQFRMTETWAGNGVPVEVPTDRSVNENESLMIRRGRFIASGDITEHFALYAQSDFNASTGAADFSLQMRDLYADIAFDKAKTFRARLGQSKVPFGFINLQSSQNRAPLERPDALNSAVEGERDLGAYLMWAPARTRTLFRDLVNKGLKGSGDYGVVAVGAFSGQGLNRSDQNGRLHWLARASYPFAAGKQIVELGVQGYTGKFVTTTQALVTNGGSVTPQRPDEGQIDQRIGVSAILYAQPIGIEAEWNVGRGPELAPDYRTIDTARLHGGSVQVAYRATGHHGTWFPFMRWQYFDGARKFAKNAPPAYVNEIDVGLEVAPWGEVEVTPMFTHTFERLRTSTAPYLPARGANRLGVQVQWNY